MNISGWAGDIYTVQVVPYTVVLVANRWTVLLSTGLSQSDATVGIPVKCALGKIH